MTQQVVEYQQPSELTLPDSAYFTREFQAIRSFQKLVREFMVPGEDFGSIVEGGKPSLFKPGAEKITGLLGLVATYEITASIEDWERPLFHYQLRCRMLSIKTGAVVAEGVGECNSMEAKYRWRNAERTCPICSAAAIIKGKDEFGGGWVCWKRKGGCGAQFGDDDPAIEDQPQGKVLNDAVYSLVNTILKMAKKRAHVDAALSVGRLSDVFTQDMEDITPDTDAAKEVPTKPRSKMPSSKPERAVPKPQARQADLILDLGTQLGWNGSELREWLTTYGYITEEGNIKSPTEAIKTLQSMVGTKGKETTQ